MENTRGEHRVGFAFDDTFRKMFERSHAARGNHGDRHCPRHGTREREVETVLRAHDTAS